MTWAKTQFERKKVHQVLVRSKHSRHTPEKKRVVDKDQRRLVNEERAYV